MAKRQFVREQEPNKRASSGPQTSSERDPIRTKLLNETFFARTAAPRAPATTGVCNRSYTHRAMGIADLGQAATTTPIGGRG